MTLPHPLLPMAAGELPWGHQSWGAGPAPHLGSTEELALDVGLLLSQVQGHECGRASPASYLLCSGISEGEILSSSFCPCHGWQAEKVGPSGVMRAGEMVLPLTCTSLGPQSRTDLMAGVWVTSPEG